MSDVNAVVKIKPSLTAEKLNAILVNTVTSSNFLIHELEKAAAHPGLKINDSLFTKVLKNGLNKAKNENDRAKLKTLLAEIRSFISCSASLENRPGLIKALLQSLPEANASSSGKSVLPEMLEIIFQGEGGIKYKSVIAANLAGSGNLCGLEEAFYRLSNNCQKNVLNYLSYTKPGQGRAAVEKIKSTLLYQREQLNGFKLTGELAMVEAALKLLSPQAAAKSLVKKPPKLPKTVKSEIKKSTPPMDLKSAIELAKREKGKIFADQNSVEIVVPGKGVIFSEKYTPDNSFPSLVAYQGPAAGIDTGVIKNKRLIDKETTAKIMEDLKRQSSDMFVKKNTDSGMHLPVEKGNCSPEVVPVKIEETLSTDKPEKR